MLMLGGEFSQVMKQGAVGTFSHPIKTAGALKKMFQAIFSEQKQFEINESIHLRDNSPHYQTAKIDFTEAGVRLSTMEEQYQVRLGES